MALSIHSILSLTNCFTYYFSLPFIYLNRVVLAEPVNSPWRKRTEAKRLERKLERKRARALPGDKNKPKIGKSASKKKIVFKNLKPRKTAVTEAKEGQFEPAAEASNNPEAQSEATTAQNSSSASS